MIDDVAIVGTSATEFSEDADAPFPVLVPNAEMQISLNFVPAFSGKKQAELHVVTDDQYVPGGVYKVILRGQSPWFRVCLPWVTAVW